METRSVPSKTSEPERRALEPERRSPALAPLAEEVQRIRRSVALSECDHVTALLLSGPRVADVVSAVCPLELYVQDGQMLHTLLLDDAARPLADLYVGAEGESVVLLVDGLDATALDSYLSSASPEFRSLDRQNLADTHRHVSLNGPYAWELLAEVLGPEVIGLPYLGFYRAPSCWCFRAGKTGEYGYDLWLPRDGGENTLERLREVGRDFDLGPASLAALDTCAHENWFFDIRRDARFGLTPLELQLQWRISYEKTYPGSARLLELRRERERRRVVLVASDEPLPSGARIELGGLHVGRVLSSEPSPTRGDVLGIALVDVPYSHPGLGTLAIDGRRTQARVVSAPAVDNLSLYVDPQRHSYATRVPGEAAREAGFR